MNSLISRLKFIPTPFLDVRFAALGHVQLQPEPDFATGCKSGRGPWSRRGTRSL